MKIRGLDIIQIGLVITLLAGLSGSAAAATWSYTFDGDDATFSGTDGWESQYCDDPWTTALNGGVCPTTDDGCNVEQCTQNSNCGYNWGYWKQWGQCIQSDPLDNHLTYGPKTWADYIFSADMRNDDDDTFGFVFRYMNSGQFYLFLVSRDIAPLPNLGCGHNLYGAALYRIEDSDGTVLGTAEGVVYEPGQVHKVRITVQGAHITVEFDADHDGMLSSNEVVFDLDDPDPLPAGQVGFYAWDNGAAGGSNVCTDGNCWFDNAEVDVLAANDPCDGISWEGFCDGDTAVYCDNGQIKEVNCNGCCAWIPNMEYYWCTNGPLCGEDCIPECDEGEFGCSNKGTHAWVCQQDADGCWLRSWTACTQTGVCDPGTGQCAGNPCEPQCVGDNGLPKECGPDGCGGECGTCPGDAYCGPDFTCIEDCVPNCEGKMCGPDGCGGECGVCPSGFDCNQQGLCQAECLPNCVGKLCGDDGCGGSCGVCPPGLICMDYQCVACIPNCEGKECGSDGCLGLCGTCPEGTTCEDFQCVEGPCEIQCMGENGEMKQCGPDGCGGFCGFCPPGLECNDAGMCMSTCVPDCTGKECGPDGCDGFCGQCDEGAVCWDGQCLMQDSCEGFCGGQAPSCLCDEECEEFGDCCPDVCDACPDLSFCGTCVPLCADPLGNPYECGPDGCGGSCGECEGGFVCQGGKCVEEGDPCALACADKECGSVNGCLCGVCEDDEACDGGQCVPTAECIPGAYKKCVDDILYWFDSCDKQGPPAEVCKEACVGDQCVDEDPGTGDVIDPEDAGPDGGGGGETVFPGGAKSSGCTHAPVAAPTAGWLLLLAMGALVALRIPLRRGLRTR